jgi:hypothetical protein
MKEKPSVVRLMSALLSGLADRYHSLPRFSREAEHKSRKNRAISAGNPEYATCWKMTFPAGGSLRLTGFELGPGLPSFAGNRSRARTPTLGSLCHSEKSASASGRQDGPVKGIASQEARVVPE